MAIADINAETTRIGYARSSGGSGGSSGGYGNPADPTLSPMERINAMYGLIAAGAFDSDPGKLNTVQKALLDDLGLWDEYDTSRPGQGPSPYSAVIRDYRNVKYPTVSDVKKTWGRLYNLPR